MEYEEFLKRLKDDLQNYYSDAGVTVDTADVQKMQGESYHGLQFTRDGTNVGFNMDMHNFFAEMENGVPYHDVMLDVRDAASEALNRSLSMGMDIEKLSNYEEMKHSLSVQIVSTEKNQEMLSRVPHQEMEDMSMVYRFDLGETVNGNASILVTNQMLRNYGITAEQLHDDAMTFAPLMHPATIRSMESVLFGIPEEESIDSDGPPKLYVVTNEKAVNGAGVITYPDFMDQAAEKMGGSFYLLPSSIHEVLIMKDTPEVDVNGLVDMVKTVNATQVEPEDRLTDNAYHYDADARVFETAHDYEERVATEHTEPKKSAETIDVLLVEPGKYPQHIQIGTDLEDLQKAVGGDIEVTYPFEDNVGLICNEEGKLNGMEWNRALYDDHGNISDVIAGPFLIAGLTEDDFCSLTDQQLSDFEDKFYSPEVFIRLGHSIMAVQVPEDAVREREESYTPKTKPAPEIDDR